MSPVPTVEVEPCPLKVPADLLALAPDTAVTALRHWFDFAIEETTNLGQLKSEIEQRIKDQAAGLFSIDEAACIAADAIGADRKKTRQAIWKAIDDGALVPLWDKARTPLPLPLTGTDKSLALIRTYELANVFEAWPLKPEPQPAPAPTKPAITAPVVEVMRHITRDTRRRTLKPEIEHAQSLCKDTWDVAEVWAELQKMAEKQHGQLLGATEDGLQYLKNGEAAIFTRDALQKRLKRSWTKTQKDRR
jgi:hypothetical protein